MALIARLTRVGLTLTLWFTALPAFAGSCICVTCAFNPKLENFRAIGEAMAPTLDAGQCSVMRHIDPFNEDVDYGQVVGLVRETDGSLFIYRVIARAGDSVAMNEGRVILNGTELPQTFIAHDDIALPDKGPYPRCITAAVPDRTCRRLRFEEKLPNGVGYHVFDVGVSPVDYMAPLTVPEGHVFVLGDHRDNASDSRLPAHSGGTGPVPIGNIRGVFDGL